MTRADRRAVRLLGSILALAGVVGTVAVVLGAVVMADSSTCAFPAVVALGVAVIVWNRPPVA